jgi:hypothetical protein
MKIKMQKQNKQSRIKRVRQVNNKWKLQIKCQSVVMRLKLTIKPRKLKQDKFIKNLVNGIREH